MTLLTEAEAGKKRCPQGLDSVCIVSACMAWRFVDTAHYRDTELWSKSRGCKVHSAYSDDAEWRPVSGNKEDAPPAPVGFCGLAGHPLNK